MKSQNTTPLPGLNNQADYNALSDEQVISEVKAGHADLFEIIVRRYNQQLFRIIRSYLSDEEDVKDIMQTTYLKAYKKLHQFRAEALFSTWLIRIAINEALKLLKKKKKVSGLHAVTELHYEDQINKPTALTPESRTIAKDMKNYIEKAIDHLPDPYRSVFIMREVEQLSTRETAICLDISQINVKVRLFRAKKMLKEELMSIVTDADLYQFRGGRCDAITQSVMKKIKDNNLP